MATGCSVYYDQVWKLPTLQLITILIKTNLINVVIIIIIKTILLANIEY